MIFHIDPSYIVCNNSNVAISTIFDLAKITKYKITYGTTKSSSTT